MRILLLLVMLLTACVTVTQHPVGQWAPIGSTVTAWVINETHDSISIRVEAPELSMTRTLGTVLACDSVLFVIPFGDTNVVVYANDRMIASFIPNAPKTWKFRSNE